MSTSNYMRLFNNRGVRIVGICFILFQVFALSLSAQMRKVYDDSVDNNIKKISFYSPSEGFVAFTDWIGYTKDSGRTFTKKYITQSNVDYNGFGVNLTFGFTIIGVKAFNSNTLIAYGDYSLVPSILYSTDGGSTFKLVYHSQFNSSQLSTGITDMIFPHEDFVGYAIDADRILKTTDQGVTWQVVRSDPGTFFNYLEATDNNNVFAFSTNYSTNKLLKTANGGGSWQMLAIPSGKLSYTHFLTKDRGWASIIDNNSKGVFYITSNGGNNWVQQNDTEATTFVCKKMKFINDSTGFALGDLYAVYKTTDSGKIWEPLPKDNKFTYLFYSHNDLQYIFDQLWTGGGHGFLELNTNTSGRPLPKAFFNIDTSNLNVANNVNLKNYSKNDYQYKWLVNGVLISSLYNASYIHDIYTATDTIKLIVSNGVSIDTAIKYQSFNPVPYPAPVVTSFTPTFGNTNTVVTIMGNYFANVSTVSFGGIAATSFTVRSLTEISAVVGDGANGNVTVTTATGTGSLPGFLTFPPPVIDSFSPTSAPIGSIVTINGTNFSTIPADNIVYFGSVRATVLTATANKLLVRVPSGANYKPITVTINHHTAYSNLSYIVTFPSTCSFTEYSFAHPKDFNLGGSNSGEPGDLVISDFDGDGKNDLVATTGYGVSILRNTGSIGTIDFAPKNNINTGMFPGGVAVGDLDGDGKPDIAFTNSLFNTVSILKNTSTNGTISFAPKIDLPASGGPSRISINDLDGDGKPDMVIANKGVNINSISIYRNISINGNIAFTEKNDISVGRNPTRISCGDLDGDGKVDLFVLDQGVLNSNLYSFTVLRNTSSIGNISFADKITFPEYTFSAIDGGLSDVDGDGKLDITIVYDTRYTLENRNGIAIYRNTSTKGNISFSTPVPYPACGFTSTISFGDLDGDSKVDLFSSCSSYGGTSLLKNVSSPTKISLISVSSPFIIIPGNFAHTNVGDLDGDGKPDLIGTASATFQVFIYRNILNEPGVLAGKDTTICNGQSLTLGGTSAAGHTYKWSSSSADFSSSDANPVVSPTANTNYFVSVTNPQGCTAYDTIKITVGTEEPLVNAGQDRVMCFGDSSKIGSPGLSTNTYSWSSIPTGYSSSFPDPSITPGMGITNYILAVNNGSCTSKDTVSITVYEKPIANAGVDEIICGKGGVTIGPTSAYPDYTYSWTSNPAGFTSTNPSPAVYPSSTTSYYLTVTNFYGCQAVDTVAVNVIDTILVPAISINGATALTEGSITMLTATTVNGGTNPYFKWQDSTNLHSWINITGETNSTLNYKPALSGNSIRCIFYSNVNCVSPQSATSNTLTFTLSTALPVKLVTFNVMHDGRNNLVKWNTVEELNLAHYEIERSVDGNLFTKIGKINVGSSNYSFIDDSFVRGINYYRLKIINKDGIYEYSEVKTINNNRFFDINIYPNPAKSIIYLNINNEKKADLLIEVIGVGSEVLFSKRTTIQAGRHLSTINIETLSAGSYFLRVSTLSKEQTVIKFEKL